MQKFTSYVSGSYLPYSTLAPPPTPAPTMPAPAPTNFTIQNGQGTFDKAASMPGTAADYEYRFTPDPQ